MCLGLEGLRFNLGFGMWGLRVVIDWSSFTGLSWGQKRCTDRGSQAIRPKPNSYALSRVGFIWRG